MADRFLGSRERSAVRTLRGVVWVKGAWVGVRSEEEPRMYMRGFGAKGGGTGKGDGL